MQNVAISVSGDEDMIASLLRRLDRIESLLQHEFNLIPMLRRRLEGILDDNRQGALTSENTF